MICPTKNFYRTREKGKGRKGKRGEKISPTHVHRERDLCAIEENFIA